MIRLEKCWEIERRREVETTDAEKLGKEQQDILLTIRTAGEINGVFDSSGSFVIQIFFRSLYRLSLLSEELHLLNVDDWS